MAETINNENNNGELEQNEARIKGIWQEIKAFLNELLDIRHDSDSQETIDSVKKDISFKGHNAWVLIFSIMVASVGLNVDSVAVIIGAMLISPLMGPIVGLGLSVAINDIQLLRKSLINLGVMVGLSLVTASLYFWISPLKEMTPQLEARTYPTILDVLVAIFGGLALIIAKAKKGAIITVITGVAIATALMPPLCTAGYGLAMGDISIFGGAMYLFTINTIYIALATFVVSKVLKFPLVSYVNAKRRKRITTIVYTIGIAVFIPSIYLFVVLLQKEVYFQKAEAFIRDNVKYVGAEVIDTKVNYDTRTIAAYVIGNSIPENMIEDWQKTLLNQEDLKSSTLIIRQGSSSNDQASAEIGLKMGKELLGEMIAKKDEEITLKNKIIDSLSNEIQFLTSDSESFVSISPEIKINYPELESISFAKTLRSNFNGLDTLNVFTLKWNNNLSFSQILEKEKRLKEWLSLKLDEQSIELKRE